VRGVLFLGVFLLLIVVLVDVESDRRIRARRDALSQERVVAVGLWSRGSMLPAAPAPAAWEELEDALLIGDVSIVPDQGEPGLRVALLDEALEVETWRRFDVAASEEEAAAFARTIAERPVSSWVAISSRGRIAPEGRTDDVLAAAMEALDARGRPHEREPVSWTYLGVRHADGWTPLAEVVSGVCGVTLHHSLRPDPERYVDTPVEFVELHPRRHVSLKLATEIARAEISPDSVKAERWSFVQGSPRWYSIVANPPAEPLERYEDHRRTCAVAAWPELTLGEEPHFQASLGIHVDPTRDSHSDGVEFRLLVNGEEVGSKRVEPADEHWYRPREDGDDVHFASAGDETGAWVPWRVPLSPWAGETVRLELVVDPLEHTWDDWAFWGTPRIVQVP
jgi:hypothetical protein